MTAIIFPPLIFCHRPLETPALKIKQYHEDELNRFLTDIGFRESGNRYDITNTWGYMGKYQFGKSTLKGLGFEVTRKEFLNNPQLQEEAMMALLLHNKEKLQTLLLEHQKVVPLRSTLPVLGCALLSVSEKKLTNDVK